MEVSIHEEGVFFLQRCVPNRKIILADGTTSVGFTRKARLYPDRATKEFLDRLLFTGLTPKMEVDQIVSGFEICVGFQATVADPGKLFTVIQLTGGGMFLQRLFGGESQKAKVQMEVTNINCQPNGREEGQFEKLTPVGKSLLFSPGQGEAKRFEVISTMTMDDFMTNWSSGLWQICASVKLVPIRNTIADLAVKDLLAANRRMLTYEVLADTTVVAQNGSEIMFHRNFLAAHSPAFERMFQTKMQEAASGVLELPDMTEEGVRALKEYLYIWELKVPQENPLVCFELFQASHKYGISTLEEATSKIFMGMGGDWYSAVVALRLFLLVKDMELPYLKKKAVEILKLKRAELKTLNEYRDLFKEKNAAVAMEVTECLASP